MYIYVYRYCNRPCTLRRRLSGVCVRETQVRVCARANERRRERKREGAGGGGGERGEERKRAQTKVGAREKGQGLTAMNVIEP